VARGHSGLSLPVSFLPPARCRLEVPAAAEGEPEFAALLFFDEITRGDSFLCEQAQA
jgi:hypothetical protein